jgi:large subunit ribosomal protein L13e
MLVAATVREGTREGRGFSLDELKEAGLDARKARKHGVPTDVLRKTKYQENVEKLKAALKSVKESPEEKLEPPKREEAPSKPVKEKATKKKKTSKKKQKKRKK